MFYSLLLPILLGGCALVGLLIGLNALSGLLRRRALWIDLTGRSDRTLRLVEGPDAFRLGIVCLIIGTAFFAVPATGALMLRQLWGSPAEARIVAPPPEGYTILYAIDEAGVKEIAYGLTVDVTRAHEHYLTFLKSDRWSIRLVTPIQIVAQKEERSLQISLIGRQVGDVKTYASKVIVTLR